MDCTLERFLAFLVAVVNASDGDLIDDFPAFAFCDTKF
jgi:hypothetical protein